MSITEQTDLPFPVARDEERENLERYLKKAGLWEQVSDLEMAKLNKAIADRASDDATIRALLELAEEEEKVSIRLLKKREEEESWRVSSSYPHGSRSQAVANSRKPYDFRLSGFRAESGNDI